MTRRIAPAVGLFFLAPLVAEFLLGNLPIVLLPAVLALAPMYGGGALLIRELARRRGLGWATIVILGLAYAVLEEGLTTQSLFNPNYAGEHLLIDGFIPALGIAVPWTIYVLGLHVFWSVSASILMAESLAGERRTTPWLGRTGLIVTGVLFALGIVITTVTNMQLWPYTSTPAQFAVCGVIVVLLVAAGLTLRVRPRPRPGTAPAPVTVLIVTLVAGAVFQGLTLDALDVPTWVGVAVWAADIVGYLALVALWSARAGWDARHYLAIGTGALLTYAWHSFAETPTGGAALAIDLIGNTVFTIGALVLIAYAWRRTTAARVPAPVPAPVPAGTGAEAPPQ